LAAPKKPVSSVIDMFVNRGGNIGEISCYKPLTKNANLFKKIRIAYIIERNPHAN